MIHKSFSIKRLKIESRCLVNCFVYPTELILSNMIPDKCRLFLDISMARPQVELLRSSAFDISDIRSVWTCLDS